MLSIFSLVATQLPIQHLKIHSFDYFDLIYSFFISNLSPIRYLVYYLSILFNRMDVQLFLISFLIGIKLRKVRSWLYFKYPFFLKWFQFFLILLYLEFPNWWFSLTKSLLEDNYVIIQVLENSDVIIMPSLHRLQNPYEYFFWVEKKVYYRPSNISLKVIIY